MYKLCPMPSIVCVSFNFLIFLFINKMTQHPFSWSTKACLSRYPSLIAVFKGSLLLRMCSIHFHFEIMYNRHRFLPHFIILIGLSKPSVSKPMSHRLLTTSHFSQNPCFRSVKCHIVFIILCFYFFHFLFIVYLVYDFIINIYIYIYIYILVAERRSRFF